MIFLKECLKDRNVASIAPSSLATVKKVCDKIDFNKKSVIVEYGPGTGVFTRYLLEKMNSESKLILIETNEYFASLLRKINDPRVFVFNDSAENIQDILSKCNEDSVDYVISGIPFSYFDEEVKNKIIKNTRNILSEKGKFLVYVCLNGIKKPLKQHFRSVKTDFELLNIPPLVIFEAEG